MSEVKTISYAKVVTPFSDNGNEVKHDNKMESKEDVECMAVNEASSNHAEDNEGFQPVTNKKNEKLKEKETQRDKEVKKRSKNKKKIRSSKEKMKEKDREKDNASVSEKFDSKESSPTPSRSEEPVEFVPAPPPKNNPWKKPAKQDSPENQSNTAEADTATATATATTTANPNPTANPADKTKVKTERKKKLSEREVKEKTDQGQGTQHTKGNPWKKVETAKEPEVPSSPKVIKVEKKSGEPSSWPKLGEEKNKKKSKTNENSSGDSGAASSLDTAEEGKENQVGDMSLVEIVVIIFVISGQQCQDHQGDQEVRCGQEKNQEKR